MVDIRDSELLIVKQENWQLHWIEAQRKAGVSPRFIIQSCKQQEKIAMLTTKSDIQPMIAGISYKCVPAARQKQPPLHCREHRRKNT